MSEDILDLLTSERSIQIVVHVGTGWREANHDVLRSIADHFKETGKNLLSGYINMLTWHDPAYTEYVSVKQIPFKERYEAVVSIEEVKNLSIINDDFAEEAIQNIINSEVGLVEPTRRYKAQKYIQRESIREEVFVRNGRKCLNCGTSENIAIDHIKPISEGGLDTIDNLQPLCQSCNSSKGSKTIDYR